MKASETKLQKILEGTQQYLVPLFQRPYSWERQQWENLWDDLIDLTEQETIRPHFMGSIVTMQTVSVPEGVSKYLLIGREVKKDQVYLTLKDKVNAKNALESLEDLAKFATYYHKLIEPNKETNKYISNFLMRIKRLELTTVYPFLLNCYDDYSDGKFAADEFVEILKILENFIIRRFVCNFPTNSLNKMFPSLYSQTKQKIDKNFMDGLKEILAQKNYPSDDQFKSRLKEVELYATRVKAEKAKLILESIEQSFIHKERIFFDNLSIEHIMPQKLNKDWEKSLGEGSLAF